MIKLRGKIDDLQMDYKNATQILTVKLNDDITPYYDDLKNKDLDIVLKVHREKRSKNANDLCWVLCTQLAKKLRTSKENIYREQIRQVGKCAFISVKKEAVNDLIKCWSRNGIGWFAELVDNQEDGYKKICLYYGTSTYDTQEMSRLIDNIVQDCKGQDIQVLSASEIDLLKREWSNE